MQDYRALEVERGNFVRSRHLQYLLAFSFWPNGEPRSPSNIYEIRSYRFVSTLCTCFIRSLYQSRSKKRGPRPSSWLIFCYAYNSKCRMKF